MEQDKSELNQSQSEHEQSKNVPGNDNMAKACSSVKAENLPGEDSFTLDPRMTSPLKDENLSEALSSSNVPALGAKPKRHSAQTDVGHKSSKLARDMLDTSSTEKSISSKVEQFSSVSAKSKNKSEMRVQEPHSYEGTSEMSSAAGPSFINAPRPESLALQASESSDESSESEPETGRSDFTRGEVKKTQPIATHSRRSKKRDQFGVLPHSLPQGTITRKGDLIEFVASDLQEKIKQSSPLSQPDAASSGSRRSSIKSYASASSSTSFATSSGLSQSPSSACQQSPDDIPPIDAAAVIELEANATRVADSVDLMMGNIRNNLHKMSAITIGCQEAYKRSVDITCDSVDASIKTMYALMAKCEELSASMGPVRQLALQIKDIKRVLDLFESQLTDK